MTTPADKAAERMAAHNDKQSGRDFTTRTSKSKAVQQQVHEQKTVEWHAEQDLAKAESIKGTFNILSVLVYLIMLAGIGIGIFSSNYQLAIVSAISFLSAYTLFSLIKVAAIAAKYSVMNNINSKGK